MSVFDGPYEKIVAEAPPQFDSLAAIAFSRADQRITELRIISATTKSNFKTALVATLAIASNELLQTWSPKALRLVHERGNEAVRRLNPELRADVQELASFTFDVFRFLLAPAKSN